LVNGKEIPKEQLTLTAFDQTFGSNEYSVAGSFPENEEINEIQVIMKVKNEIQNTISLMGSDLEQSPTESFLKRLWAFKRINYLLTDKEDCTKGLSALFKFGNVDGCREEALNLALEYSFVTDLTSLVIEENNSYTKMGPVQVNKNPKYATTTKPFSSNRNYRPSLSSGSGILAGPGSTAHFASGGGSPLHATSSGSLLVSGVSIFQKDELEIN
jgi:hypothetical protein